MATTVFRMTWAALGIVGTQEIVTKAYNHHSLWTLG